VSGLPGVVPADRGAEPQSLASLTIASPFHASYLTDFPPPTKKEWSGSWITTPSDRPGVRRRCRPRM